MKTVMTDRNMTVERCLQNYVDITKQTVRLSGCWSQSELVTEAWVLYALASSASQRARRWQYDKRRRNRDVDVTKLLISQPLHRSFAVGQITINQCSIHTHTITQPIGVIFNTDVYVDRPLSRLAVNFTAGLEFSVPAKSAA